VVDPAAPSYTRGGSMALLPRILLGFTGPLMRVFTLGALGAVIGLAGCDQTGESVFEVENHSSYDLAIVIAPVADHETYTIDVASGTLDWIYHSGQDLTPPLPESLSTLHADATLDGVATTVYTQDPVDSKYWQHLVASEECLVYACARYVLTLTDADLTLPAPAPAN
jgi:hypothetical protein